MSSTLASPVARLVERQRHALAARAYYAAVGVNILAARLQAGLTRDQLGRRLGITASAYGRIERGEQEITVTRFLLLVALLGVTPSALLPQLRGRPAPNVPVGRSWAFRDHRTLAAVDASPMSEKND